MTSKIITFMTATFLTTAMSGALDRNACFVPTPSELFKALNLDDNNVPRGLGKAHLFPDGKYWVLNVVQNNTWIMAPILKDMEDGTKEITDQEGSVYIPTFDSFKSPTFQRKVLGTAKNSDFSEIIGTTRSGGKTQWHCFFNYIVPGEGTAFKDRYLQQVKDFNAEAKLRREKRNFPPMWFNFLDSALAKSYPELRFGFSLTPATEDRIREAQAEEKQTAEETAKRAAEERIKKQEGIEQFWRTQLSTYDPQKFQDWINLQLKTQEGQGILRATYDYVKPAIQNKILNGTEKDNALKLIKTVDATEQGQSRSSPDPKRSLRSEWDSVSADTAERQAWLDQKKQTPEGRSELEQLADELGLFRSKKDPAYQELLEVVRTSNQAAHASPSAPGNAQQHSVSPSSYHMTSHKHSVGSSNSVQESLDAAVTDIFKRTELTNSEEYNYAELAEIPITKSNTNTVFSYNLMTTLEALKKLYTDGDLDKYKIGVLHFSGLSVDFKRMNPQETGLLLSTTLAKSLSRFKNHIFPSSREKLANENGVIISEPTTLFRWLTSMSNDQLTFQPINKPINFVVVSSAIYSDSLKRTTPEEERRILKEKIFSQLAAFAKSKTDVIILGNWGGRLFLPDVTSSIYASLLENEFKNVFKKVIFAIPDSSALSKFESAFNSYESQFGRSPAGFPYPPAARPTELFPPYSSPFEAPPKQPPSAPGNAQQSSAPKPMDPFKDFLSNLPLPPRPVPSPSGNAQQSSAPKPMDPFVDQTDFPPTTRPTEPVPSSSGNAQQSSAPKPVYLLKDFISKLPLLPRPVPSSSGNAQQSSAPKMDPFAPQPAPSSSAPQDKPQEQIPASMPAKPAAAPMPIMEQAMLARAIAESQKEENARRAHVPANMTEEEMMAKAMAESQKEENARRAHVPANMTEEEMMAKAMAESLQGKEYKFMENSGWANDRVGHYSRDVPKDKWVYGVPSFEDIWNLIPEDERKFSKETAEAAYEAMFNGESYDSVYHED